MSGRAEEFFGALLTDHPEWRSLVRREGAQALRLEVAAPPGSDLSAGLTIECAAGEATIGFDEGHVHLNWQPDMPPDPEAPWLHPVALIEAILSEEIVCSSGWKDGRMRVASLHGAEDEPDLLVPGLDRVRTRSWHGRHDRDR